MLRKISRSGRSRRRLEIYGHIGLRDVTIQCCGSRCDKKTTKQLTHDQVSSGKTDAFCESCKTITPHKVVEEGDPFSNDDSNDEMWNHKIRH